jgi:microcystin-dependent protein
MSEAFVGEIRLFAGNFAPRGWAKCDGAILRIDEYETLFTLIGTTYGGDGQITFALPNLSERVPLGTGQGFVLGESGGTESITITNGNLPRHNHPFQATAAMASMTDPTDHLVGQQSSDGFYRDDSAGGSVPFQSNAITAWGTGGEPVNNLMPSLTMTYIISLYGTYPPIY